MYNNFLNMPKHKCYFSKHNQDDRKQEFLEQIKKWRYKCYGKCW